MSALELMAEAGTVESGVSLAAMTTYKFGGPARWFAAAGTAEEVAAVIGAAMKDGVEYLVVGRGSNLVISDAGFPGLVVKLGGELAAIQMLDEGVIQAGAAVPLPKLARAAAKEGRGGLEFLVAVPGSVGGAVRMNAGCHGSETGEWLRAVDVYRPGAGLMQLERSDLTMTYRHSSLPTGDVVLGARFRTVPRLPEDSEEIMRDITAWRKANQPGGTFNAGSVFKNPPGISAGHLIDSLGLKGFAVGGARVSPKHANFFEASPDASAQDVYDLVIEVQAKVLKATGTELAPEVRFAGHFERPDGRRGFETVGADNGNDVEGTP